MRTKPPSEKIKRVVIIGPECTGKSELSEYLANHYRTSWVPEYAREYIDQLSRPYRESDLLEIARGQLRMEDKLVSKAHRLLVCDTNLIVIKVWSYFKYGRCDEEIIGFIQSRPYDLYLFTHIDIPWENDPQREHPNERLKLWNIYREELQNQKTPFVDIRGDREQRRETAIMAMDKLLRETWREK